MKKYLFMLPILAIMLLGSGYTLAIADGCCLKTSCACTKAGCCADGKCACKGGCCVNGNCRCADNGCNTKCNCQKQ